jgi:predicted esterase
MKKALLWILFACLVLGLGGCAAIEAGVTDADYVSPDSELPGTPHAMAGYIVVRGFEWGPGVNKVIVQLDTEVDSVVIGDTLDIFTAHYQREVTDAYLCDSLGNAVKTSSEYVAFDLETNFDCTGSPFEMDEDTELNIWADEYIVNASFTVMKDGVYFPLTLEADCIENRLCPELDRFTNQGTYTGVYTNPLTGQEETLSLNYAAYEPDSIASWEQNPLIIWLHGLGEGGTDITKTILGNEVSALTEQEIQSHFTSGDQTGAYVLVVQTPTYWMDAGNSTYHMGDMPSRYTEILMDTILNYLEINPDVDPDRIYIGGCSNGGYMTLDMLINYPDFFAAAVPCCPAYSYYIYAKDYLGSYRMASFKQYIKTDDLYLTDDKVEALLNTPVWFIQAANDYIVPAEDFTLPVYRALIDAGADNAWCSLYFDVVGTESSGTQYLGHWSWIYLLNDQVEFVQDVDSVLSTSASAFMYGFTPDRRGGTVQVTDADGNIYESIFDWMNDQVRD